MTEYEFNEFPTELELSSIEDLATRHQMLVQRIIAASMAIVNYGKRGPANYISIHEDKWTEIYAQHSYAARMELKLSKNEDIVIIGRHDIGAEDIDIQLKLT
jgi:hypothetical protein